MLRTRMITGLGAHCAAARIGSGTSVESIAAALGVSEGTIHNFENGKAWPRRVEEVVDAYAIASKDDASELWSDAAASMRKVSKK
jgi:DNA-binding XRE family transcriptional regulator